MIQTTALDIATILLLLPAVVLLSGWIPFFDRPRQARTLCAVEVPWGGWADAVP
jgi:hypothetical protein